MLLRIYCETNEGAQYAAQVLMRYVVNEWCHVEDCNVLLTVDWDCEDPAGYLQELLLDFGAPYVPLRAHIETVEPCHWCGSTQPLVDDESYGWPYCPDCKGV